mgnify:CR=1 FL=1
MKDIKNNIESDEIIWSSIKLQLKDIYGEAEYSNWLKLLTFNKVEKEIIIDSLPYQATTTKIIEQIQNQMLEVFLGQRSFQLALCLMWFRQSS